jgi:preprotein translocase subunit SecA
VRARLLVDELFKTRFAGQSERLLLRGLHFAVVDEADSVLIDEARTP